MAEWLACGVRPEALRDPAGRLDAQEGVLRRRRVKASRLGVGEESIRPPDLVEHLVADAQLLLALVEHESLVVPELAEVEVKCVVLNNSNYILVLVNNVVFI